MLVLLHNLLLHFLELTGTIQHLLDIIILLLLESLIGAFRNLALRNVDWKLSLHGHAATPVELSLL